MIGDLSHTTLSGMRLRWNKVIEEPVMTGGTVIPSDLRIALQRHSTVIWRPKSAILFRRGEKASGIYMILQGTVTLDFGAETSRTLTSCCESGALLGLPGTLTKGVHTMTATVAQDAELAFCSSHELEFLLRERPSFCGILQTILWERMAETQTANKASPHAAQSASSD
jgi:CRP-like cAMP-binding protein